MWKDFGERGPNSDSSGGFSVRSGERGLTVTPVGGSVRSGEHGPGPTATPVGGTVSARESVGGYSVRSGERWPDSESSGG